MLKFDSSQLYFYPTSAELLLIRAALGDVDEAVSNLERWIKHHNFKDFSMTKGHALPHIYDRLEEGSKKLLPMVYSNFKRLKIDHQVVNQFASFHRYTLYSNRLIRNELDERVKELDENQIPYYLRKGMSFLTQYYDDFGARPTQDIDIVLPREYASEYLKQLTRAGWKCIYDWELNPIEYSLAHAITLKKKHFELDLHWRFGHHPVPMKWETLIGGKTTLKDGIMVLPNELNVIDALVHGYRFNRNVRPIRWVCDAHKIIESGIDDWEMIVSYAEECEMVPPIYGGLKFLSDNRISQIPDEVLVALSSIQVSKESLKYHKRVGSSKTNGFANIAKYASSTSQSRLSFTLKIMRHYRFVWNQSDYLHLLMNAALILIEKVFIKKKIFLKSVRNI